MDWLVVATWSFSLPGAEEAARRLAEGACDARDAAEVVARAVEDDPDVATVGYGGIPAIDGEVELDAAFMDGRNLAIGAVAAMKGFRHPVSVARRLCYGSPRTFLVGRGAEEYAAACGYAPEDLLTDKARAVWEREVAERAAGRAGEPGHDTVGVVALDRGGRMVAATSTSGLALKPRGRVGDSPLPGSGYYVDDEVGGAAATGVGEDIMKGCLCFLAVEMMRQGLTPMRAAEEALRRTRDRLVRGGHVPGNMALVCADRRGAHGGAANHEGFSYSIASPGCTPVVVPVPPIP